MRFIFALYIGLLSGCQTRPGPKAIDYPQLKSYLTQKNEVALWSSKARSAALGGRAPKQHLAPTFGMPFSEAKVLAHVLDLRSIEDFQRYNLTSDPSVLVPISNLPGKELVQLSDDEGRALVSQKGLNSESIVILICSRGAGASELAQKIFTWGYPRVLNYAGEYSDLPGCTPGKP